MVEQYLTEIIKINQTGIANEENYYDVISNMLVEIASVNKVNIDAIATPKTEDNNKPDIGIKKQNTDDMIGMIEVKDVDKNLDAPNYREQFDRYKQSYENLIITNLLEYRLYLNGKEFKRIKIAELNNAKIIPIKENFDDFKSLIQEFLSKNISLKQSDLLAEMMASKSHRIKDEILNSFKNEADKSKFENDLEQFKTTLNPNITQEEYASTYSQIMIYAIFIARLYYKGDSNDFNLKDVSECLPKSNEFLQNIFNFNSFFISTDKIKNTLQSMVDVIKNSNIEAILEDFSKDNKYFDPIIDFYEIFLEKFDPKVRKDHGIWYTPQPIVSFIMRQVDLILKNTFDIKEGLLDIGEKGIHKKDINNIDKLGHLDENNPENVQPQVQLLDPATGTGTFLVETIRLMFENFMFSKKYSKWENFVRERLVENIYGFEIIASAYVLAHLKMDIMLQHFGLGADDFISQYTSKQGIFQDDNNRKYVLQTYIRGRQMEEPETLKQERVGNPNINDFVSRCSGYHITGDYQHPKCNILLTNSLDDYNGINDEQNSKIDIFNANHWIKEEGKKSRDIKRNKKIMCVVGNPPYNASSINKGKWIMELLDDYKFTENQDGKKINLLQGERNIKPLSDDYIKFIRYGEHRIEQNREGILAYITNNSYLDGITQRVMRKHLLDTFDDIYIINLHGDARRDKDLMKNGDKNVFNIMQGVAISIFVKKNHQLEVAKNPNYKKPIATVHYKDLSGDRYEKFTWLDKHNIFDDGLPLTLKEDSASYYPEFENREIIDWDKEWRPEENSNYLFVPKNEDGKEEYEEGFKVDDLFKLWHSGFTSHKDEINVRFSANEAQQTINDFITLNKNELKTKYNVSENIDWNFDTFIDIAKNNKYQFLNGSYRAFDDRIVIYSTKVGAFARARYEVMQHLINHNNIAIITRKLGDGAFITNKITDSGIMSGRSSVFLLYTFNDGKRTINFSEYLLNIFADNLGIQFIASQENDLLGDIGGNIVSGFYNQYDDKTKFNELHLFDYIYAVLNDKEYKQKYKTFLEMDFPRVPYPNDVEDFFNKAKKGEQLRHLHLMEIADPNKYNCIDYTQLELTYRENSIIKRACILEGEYEIDNSRNNLIENVKKEQVENLTITAKLNSNNTKSFPACRVWINKYQYFVIPEFLWDYQIGTYRPVQEYLKKRIGRILTAEECNHFIQIVKVILETEQCLNTNNTKHGLSKREEYEKYFELHTHLPCNSIGMQATKDEFTISFDKHELQDTLNVFKTKTEAEVRNLYSIKDTDNWKLASVQKMIIQNQYDIIKIHYRVFDYRYTAYTKTKGWIARPSYAVNQHLLHQNIALMLSRGIKEHSICFITNYIADIHCYCDCTNITPLYIFNSTGERKINISSEMLKTFSDTLAIPFLPSQENDLLGGIGGNIVSDFYNQYDDKTKFNELHLFDYIYAVLNDKDYKQKYKTFLEMDFPRVPYPNNVEDFFNQAKQGEKLRHLHLMEFANPNKYNCIDYTQLELTYQENSITKPACILEGEYETDKSRNNLIENVKNEPVENLTITAHFHDNHTKSFPACRVWINKYQYFVIPEFLWDYQIGTYKPIQEYLKKRKNRIFTPEEQQHWRDVCKIISICKEL